VQQPLAVEAPKESLSGESVPLEEEKTVQPPELEVKTDSQDDLKPYIEEPFIKDPFISLPSFPQAPPPNSQSYNSSHSPISFQITIPHRNSQPDRLESPKSQVAVSHPKRESHGKIELPLRPEQYRAYDNKII
jgi:poly-gamma-glutamate synthesis protein (capsule biosynthesis protein)